MIGFMEGIYGGILDKSFLEAYRPPRKTPRVEKVLRAYHALLKDHPPSVVEQQGRVPDDMLRKMGEMGLFGLSIPEAYGGLGFDLGEYLETVEGLAQWDLSLALVSIAHLSIGNKGVVLFGTDEQKEKYLMPAATGETIFSYALTEPKTGSDARHIETWAERSPDGRHYILNGQKTYITNANYAGCLTVFAQLDPGRPGHMGAFLVETGWDGVQVGKDMPKMGLKASSTAAIQFKDVRVPVENLLGRPGDGFKIAMTILNYGRLGLGAASAGMMAQSLADMKKRASSRIQFGVPIQDFPLIQEKLVRARVNREVCSAMDALTAAFLENDPLANVAIESSHCKLFGTTRAWDTLYDALQVAGGSGFLTTQPYEKRMRDFRVTPIFEGTTEIHSIYPALFALRRMVKDMAAYKDRTLPRWAFYRDRLVQALRSVRWPLAFDDAIMKKASRLARANAKTIRWMLLKGSLYYGSKVGGEELFLRRVTTLSLYTYGLLALVAKMEADRKAGGFGPEDRDILEYFVEEARLARKADRKVLDSRRESLMKRIFRRIN